MERKYLVYVWAQNFTLDNMLETQQKVTIKASSYSDACYKMCKSSWKAFCVASRLFDRNKLK